MDVTTETIQEELRSTGVIEPAWLTVPMAVRYSSVSRSKLYQAFDEGEVKSVCLRDRDKTRGTRLVSRASLEKYLLKHENIKSEPVPGRKGRKSKQEMGAGTL